MHDNLDRIIEYLYLDSGTPVIPNKTLLFLDEIQRTPEVFAKLRYFYEKRNDIHIIAAGSLLDFILADHTFSMPVGRIEYLFMGPMTFMEFLKACEENPLFDLIKQYRISEIIPDPIHQKILDFLRS